MKNLAMIATAVAVCSAACGARAESWVTESPRQIPVAYTVDVVVVGGSTGAVSAAVAAAKAGAKVFLATPRPYLGDDMTATLRLWLGEGRGPNSPLARRIFAAPGQTARTPAAYPNAIRLTYRADLRSAAKHKDAPRGKLTDGLWGSAGDQSVQYDGDVTVTADLGKVQPVDKAVVMIYHRKDFLVDCVVVSASIDGKQWQPVGSAKNDAPPQAYDFGESALPLAVTVGKAVRYLKLQVKRRPGAARVLLGEILALKPAEPKTAPKPEPKPKPAYTTRATPFHVKKTLDEALIAAGVRFLYGCYATDVLRDADGKPCGIVMANRAGRQAVVAGTIVDATDRGVVARMAGAAFRPYPAGKQTFRRVVIGGKVRSGSNVTSRKVGPPWTTRAGGRRGGLLAKGWDVIEYTLTLPMKDDSFASWARADQVARDLTYHADQQFTSDGLFQVPPDAMRGRKRGTGEWPGAAKLDLAAFRPAGVERVFVLSGCADMPRDHAARLLEPLELMAMGERIGRAAAETAKAAGQPKAPHVPGRKGPRTVAGDVREILVGVRPIQALPTVPQAAGALPVLGRYDVVVIGGGTGGAPAGIAAARRGARTLVVEYQYGLGGVGTLGAISTYYHGYRGGFTAQVPGSRWAIEARMEWWRAELRKAGADIWFGTLGCGALVRDLPAGQAGGKVIGAVVATPHGRGVVLADVVIDGTGNADIAAAGGAACVYTDASTVAVQGTGLPPRALGRSYTNTDFTIVDETDMLDIWHVYVYAKHKYAARRPFDMGKLIDTRERRRILGEFTMSVLDQVNRRTYGDTVAQAATNYDTHGYTIHPFFELTHPGRGVNFRVHVPYRCLLPKGLDGLLVIGLGISVHRDAVPLIRMQPDVQNLGYAAGCAAALAAASDKPTRKIDLRALQKHLVETKCLPETVLTDSDSYPMSDGLIAQAVESAADGYKGAGVILAHPDRALPLVRSAYAAAKMKEHRLTYAHILAVLGDSAGVGTLLEAVNAAEVFDAGWRYKGMGQFGGNMSRLDKLIVALGRTGDRRATPAILRKLGLLSAKDAFSHFRATAMALEKLKDPAGAEALAALLAKPGIAGHARANIARAIERGGRNTNSNDTTERSKALRELLLARALFLCGDKDGVGKTILLEYTRDLRGHLARHARAVLNTDR